MKTLETTGYNERLFGGGIRRKLHMARFDWVSEQLAEITDLPADYSMIELGCFDGKLVDNVSKRPGRYLGLDAGWEGGLEDSLESVRTNDRYELRECQTPEDMMLGAEQFDISVCMETFEHIPPELVEPYIAALAAATTNRVLITVPNETGPVFLAKYLAKLASGGDVQEYKKSEILHATLRNMDRVERHDHKGFDYRWLRDIVAEYFDVTHVSGHPAEFLGPSLGFGIGIVGISRN